MATVVIAPDSFKGSIAASAAARSIAAGWASLRSADTLVLRPMADGGEGTLDAFESVAPGRSEGGSSAGIRRRTSVTRPDNRRVDAEWLQLPDGGAVIELATASGLHLLDPLLPLDAHTLGFGELIMAALEAGATRLVLGVGGSASTDGGVGLLTALGARFIDEHGEWIPQGNRGLGRLESVDLSALPNPPEDSVVLTDVTNPLLGVDGAARVFGPQKGAEPPDAETMDANLARLVRVTGAAHLASQPGAGAAGGAGFGLLLWGIPVAPGARTIGELIGLPSAIEHADLVITGEGRFDSQTASGKVVEYVRSIAASAGVPLSLVAGSIDAPTDPFQDAVSLTLLSGGATPAMAKPARWLYAAGALLASRFE